MHKPPISTRVYCGLLLAAAGIAFVLDRSPNYFIAADDGLIWSDAVSIEASDSAWKDTLNHLESDGLLAWHRHHKDGRKMRVKFVVEDET